MAWRTRTRSLALVTALAASACASRSEGPRGAPPESRAPAEAISARPAATVASAAAPVETGPCAPQPGGRDFPVGPGRRFAAIGDVPLESLRAGDSVRIAWREEPYREKIMISGRGTAERPIRICGIPGPNGALPVIDGANATTRRTLNFPFDGHQVRGLVIIGHAHSEDWKETPSHIVLEGLEIRNASPDHTFTDRSGKVVSYSKIAAGVFVERAHHLVIRGCTVTANNTGLFLGTGGGPIALTRDVLLEGNHVYENGSLEDYYEHNVYNEASDVTYQYNHFGSPRGGKAGVLGANIKERSAGVVIRYNWIEDGAHLLDIVDAQESKDVTVPMASFHATYVYGNVVIRGAKPGGTMIHYGGDSEVFPDYRKGTLYFYDNTVVVENAAYPSYTRTAVFELSTNEEHLVSRNNVYASDVPADDLHAIGLLGSRDQVSSGLADFAGDWVMDGITAHDLTRGAKVDLRAKVTGLDRVARGPSPGFRDRAAEDFTLLPAAVRAPVALPPVLTGPLLPTREYVKHAAGRPRTGAPTIGAFGAP